LFCLSRFVLFAEAAPKVMARMMPSEMAVYLVDYHKQRGVRVLTSARPFAVDGHGTTLSAVLLKDGRSVEADLVVVGIGITPEVELARSGGLKVENGIVTAAYCQTSEAGIYAAGDAAAAFVSRGAWKEGAELIFALKGDRLRGAAGQGERTDVLAVVATSP